MKHPLWVLTQQEQDKTADHYACQYLSSIKDDAGDWVASLYRAVEYRCFFGTMTILEVYKEEDNMKKFASKGDYIVCLGCAYRGFIFKEVVNETNVSTIIYDTFDQCLERMTRQGLDKQFDRGKSVIYAKTARDRAIPAIQCWLIIGKRLRVVRDIRILIAKRLWANKHTWVT